MIAFATLAEARRGSICAVVLAFGAMVALVLCRGVPRLLSLGIFVPWFLVMLVDDIIPIRWVLAPTKEILSFTMSQGFHVVVAFLISTSLASLV